MDEYIKQSISTRRDAIEAFYGAGAEGKKKVAGLFDEIEELGDKCKDVGEFEAEFAKSPLNQKYLDLFTELSIVGAGASGGGMAGNCASAVVDGVMEGVADRALDEAKRAVLPTRAAVHQKAYDEVRKVSGLGDAIDIGEKASYAMHLGKLFKSRKKKQDE
ncbi:hypothetical protein [Candidatus Nanosyncoccus alces]|uniref:Uncharacterized protein n=1 Tax=Candidatus Nanosyncoccus alces TaxID=2171997 RepID=A0ABY0FNJ3_9BACT|nr:hypothetical protein [Candidatus Nanosyncoccus alces]RYC74924.1 hypothetical protein G3RUM_00200 [Candidatus Nanosyncoccus alces]